MYIGLRGLGQASGNTYAAALQNVVATAKSPDQATATLAQTVAALAQAVASKVPSATGLPTDPAALASAAAAAQAQTAQQGKPPVDQWTEGAVIVARGLLAVVQALGVAVPSAAGLPANPEGDLRNTVFQAEHAGGLAQSQVNAGLNVLAQEIAAVAQAAQAAGFALTSGPGTTASGGSAALIWIGVGVAAVAVVGGTLFLLLRKRKKG